MRRSLPVLGLALGWLLACAGTPFSPQIRPEERRAYTAALSVLSDDAAAGEQRLEEFIRSWPESPLAASASIQLGELSEARGDREAALRRFYHVVQKFPHASHSAVARLHIARLEYARGDTAAAKRMRPRIQLGGLSKTELRLAYRLFADMERKTPAKLRWLSMLRKAENNSNAVAEIDAEIDALLQQLDVRGLLEVADRVAPDIPAARALVSAAERLLDRGDLDRAQRLLERASRMPLEPAYVPQRAHDSERFRALEFRGTDTAGFLPSFQNVASPLPLNPDVKGVIGAVLPLSGKFSTFGEESLRGILLAAGVFDAPGASRLRPNIRVLIHDSGGSPARAAAAVRELAAEESISAVIGPLLSEECEAAAAEAQATGIPLLTLTSREEVARDRSQVFRLRTMPRDEIEVLADYVIYELDAQRFGILYPRDAYGRGLSGLFWNAVEARGGSVVALAAYEPDSTDFAAPIRRLTGWELLTHEEEKVIEEREELIRSARRLPTDEAAKVREDARTRLGPDYEPLPPIVDFDALFIPESHEKIVLIAPQLAYHEATGTRLLGSNAWNHPDLVSIGRHHVEGALFTTNFYADSPIAFVREFADRYEATYGMPAEDLAAQAYDATHLVLAQFARGRNSRTEVRKGVLATSGFPGVSGILTIREDGNARKRPFLLGVARGRVIQVD